MSPPRPANPSPQQPRSQHDQIYESTYLELRKIADRHLARNSLNRQLTSTDLVHEAWLKLNGTTFSCRSRTHFYALGSRAMRQILVDRARRRSTQKRGGAGEQVSLDECRLSADNDAHVMVLDDALTLLEQQSPEQAAIVEMRFFSGMKIPDVAEQLGRSTRWVEREWTLIRAWLRAELSKD
jgi:RNA polymerase sigma factor (TIGR02999 family)